MKIEQRPLLTPEATQAVSIHDPLLAEVRMFAQAYREGNASLRRQALAYARLNEETALLEAVTHSSLCLTQQEYASPGKFRAYGQNLTEILAKGLRRSEMEARDDYRLEPEVTRRMWELREQEFLDQAARAGVLNDHVMVVISPYPSEMDADTAKKLGYVPEEQIAKIRIHDYHPELASKTTASISFTESDLRAPKVETLLRMEAQKTGGHVLQLSDSLLGTYFFLPKSGGENWQTVLTTVSPGAFSEKDKEVVDDSRRVMSEAEPLIEELINLDQDLAISVAHGFPTLKVRQIIDRYLKSDARDGLFSREDRELLELGKVIFNEDVARLLKKMGLTNSYLQVAILSDQASVAGREYDSLRRQLKAGVSLFDNQNLDYALASLVAPMEMAFCGYGFTSPWGGGSAYGYYPDMIRGYLFGSIASGETRKTTCPNCKHEWLLTEKHADHGIKCSCGSKVEGGSAAKCIVDSSKKASGLDMDLFIQADVCD